MKEYTVVITIKEGRHLSPTNTNEGELTQSYIVQEGERIEWGRVLEGMFDVMKD